MLWEVIWMTLIPSVIGATVGYVLGISRDRYVTEKA